MARRSHACPHLLKTGPKASLGPQLPTHPAGLSPERQNGRCCHSDLRFPAGSRTGQGCLELQFSVPWGECSYAVGWWAPEEMRGAEASGHTASSAKVAEFPPVSPRLHPDRRPNRPDWVFCFSRANGHLLEGSPGQILGPLAAFSSVGIRAMEVPPPGHRRPRGVLPMPFPRAFPVRWRRGERASRDGA